MHLVSTDIVTIILCNKELQNAKPQWNTIMKTYLACRLGGSADVTHMSVVNSGLGK